MLLKPEWILLVVCNAPGNVTSKKEILDELVRENFKIIPKVIMKQKCNLQLKIIVRTKAHSKDQ